jgi:hypothetical protein
MQELINMGNDFTAAELITEITTAENRSRELLLVRGSRVIPPSTNMAVTDGQPGGTGQENGGGQGGGRDGPAGREQGGKRCNSILL